MAPIPLTPVYGLPFEAPGDQPLISLTGGQSGTEPILAEEVETELERIDADVAGLQTEVDNRVALLDEADVTGLDISTVSLTVPAGYEHLQVIWHGITDGGAVTWLTMRLNGDSGSNYGFSAWAFESGSSTESTATGAILLRVGRVGAALRSGGVIWVHSYPDGNPVTANGNGAHHISGGRGVSMGGGTWAGTTPVTSIAVAPLNQSWTSGQLSLYGYK